MRTPVATTLLVLSLVSCAPRGTGPAGAPTEPTAEPATPAVDTATPMAADTVVAVLMGLARTGDYFGLRDRLEVLDVAEDSRLRLLRAEVAHAFNDPAESNRRLRVLGPELAGLPDTLRVTAARLRFRNHVRLHDYAAAAAAARALLALPAVDSTVRADVENEARAMAALADAPPQRVVSRLETELRRRPDGRVPVTINDSARAYVFDTGANLSTLMRSEARALGLRVREAGIRVGTSTSRTITADVAVAPRVRLGSVELAHVVFLVVPDELLTFGDFRIPGLLGFPVFDALGEVEFRRGGVLRIPADVPDRPVRNLALRYFTPLIRVDVLGDRAICEFDTGANRTSLHRPFFRRNRGRIVAEGRPDTIRTAGVGGEVRLPAYVLTDLPVTLGETTVELPSVAAYTEPVATGDAPPSDCRLGLDALAGFDGYLLNLRSMTFLPR